MASDFEPSIGQDLTVGARKPSHLDNSLGGDRTIGGGDAAGVDTVLDDIEVVDLESRYRIERTLGEGGMGAVLLATDMRLGRKVAIKRILGDAARSKTAIMRFLTEAQAIAALNHPNIVQIYDYGRAKDGPFLIMEYVDGGSLADRCKQGAIALDDAVTFACQICDGLAKAHDAGIVHRDIKPANVLLTRDGLPKLTDFGLARNEAADHGMTATGLVIGTLDFMPPEQRRDASQADHRSDLWSLAATTYQMVTGRNPRLIRFNDIPATLQSVLAKAFEDRKDARYQSARELRDALMASIRITDVAFHEATEGTCGTCGVQNDPSRKFCKGCGGSLLAPCLACDMAIPNWDEICGSCGAKQTPLADERRKAMAFKQAEAEELLSDCWFDHATRIATQLRDEAHPRLKYLSGWAISFLDKMEKLRAEQTQQAAEAMVEAVKHEAAYDYPSAASALETIPLTMRSAILPGMREPAAGMLERVKTTQAEVRRLEKLVKERLAARQLDELLPEINKLHALRPDREDVRRIRAQLVERSKLQVAARDEAVATAKAALACHDYDRAFGAISGVPPSATTPEVVALREEAALLVRVTQKLAQKLKQDLAAEKLDGLLPIAEQYLRLKPGDTEVAKLRQSLVDREAKVSAEIAARLEQASQLEKACRFDEAIRLLRGIPEARQTAAIGAAMQRCGLLGQRRQVALKSLSIAKSGNFAEVIDASGCYRVVLTEAGITDSEFLTLLSKAEAAHANEVQWRRMVWLAVKTATTIAAGIAVVLGGLWIRSAAREAALASAIAQGRWDDALAIEPLSPGALVGRARSKLGVNPADNEGAFEDLQSAVRGGANQALLGLAQATIAEAWLALTKQAAANDVGAEIKRAADESAKEWLAAAVASLPPILLASLPPAVLASLPPAAMLRLPPIRNSIGMELKLLPPGTFTMGQIGGDFDETPHQVTLTQPFCMGVYEVTNTQWKRVMGDVPSKWKEDARPVERVSWGEAVQFCQKLSALPEEQQAGLVYRLPTEAEWEYACRAGTNTQYSFGDDESLLSKFDWYRGNSGRETHPVGQKKPNVWGLYDMHGNVSEWCSGSYRDYASSALTVPQGLSRSFAPARRGGNWGAAPCPSAYRSRVYDSSGHFTQGFRIAMSPHEAQPVPPETEK